MSVTRLASLVWPPFMKLNVFCRESLIEHQSLAQIFCSLNLYSLLDIMKFLGKWWTQREVEMAQNGQVFHASMHTLLLCSDWKKKGGFGVHTKKTDKVSKKQECSLGGWHLLLFKPAKGFEFWKCLGCIMYILEQHRLHSTSDASLVSSREMSVYFCFVISRLGVSIRWCWYELKSQTESRGCHLLKTSVVR